MLLDVIYSFFLAVTVGHFRPYPDVIFLGSASNPICLCLWAGRDTSWSNAKFRLNLAANVRGYYTWIFFRNFVVQS